MECQGAQMFVYNISEAVKERQLREIFDEEDTVVEVINTRRGYAFITYTLHQGAN